MRKVLDCRSPLAGSALAFATPAAAQYYPRRHRNAYGYNWILTWLRPASAALQVRIDNVQRQIRRSIRRDLHARRPARPPPRGSDRIESRLQRRALWPERPRSERHQRRIARLEQRVQVRSRAATANNYNRAWSDRDHDGRNDRYEDDRGYRHD